MSGEDIPVSRTVFISLSDESLDMEGDLGIGDDRRKQGCVRMSAGPAEDPCDPEQEGRISLPESAGITTIPDKAAEMAAGTGKHS